MQIRRKPYINFVFKSLCVLFFLFNSCDAPQPINYESMCEADNKSKACIEVASEKPGDTITSVVDSSLNRLKRKIEHKIGRRIKRTFFNGNILFAKNGEILFEACKGFSNYKTRDSLCLNSSFQLASVSKPITAFTVLKLVGEKRIKLTDTLQTYLPNFPMKNITIEMLLTHKSGLNRYMFLADHNWVDRETNINNDQVLDLYEFLCPEPNYRPNRYHHYNNTNYMLLASIIEKVVEMDFETYMQDSIFSPLGMNDTKIFNNENELEIVNKTSGHHPNLRPVGFEFLDGVVGDKGVYSTIYDLLKFDQALYDCAMVPCELLEKAFTKKTRKKDKNSYYGYGWRIRNHEKLGNIVYHSGWWKGYKSFFIRIPEVEGTIIILSNTVRGQFFSVDDLVDLYIE